MIRKNPYGDTPKIHKSSFVDPSAVIIGRVEIGKNVFVAPGAVLRADEKNSFVRINENCNIQDRVVVHALQASSVVVGKGTSLSHACIIHGPCSLGENCFIGFGCIVFNAKLADYVFVDLRACISSVSVRQNRAVEIGAVIDTQKKADALRPVPKGRLQFSRQVLRANQTLLKGYKRLAL
jgi:carbonic anhydrase/acetyltransferase-like protein (isoleucine patch superfamily)